MAPPNVTVVSSLPPEHSGYRVADHDMVRAVRSAEDRHFWFAARNHFIGAQLARLGVRPPASILDVGCGAGAVAAYLSGKGYSVTGVDGHLDLVLEAALRAPTGRFFVHDVSRGLESLGQGRFDVVGLFDVIEHLDEPQQALDAAVERVRPGGVLVGTVPALACLWSAVDVRSGHRRRYGRGDLASVLAATQGVVSVEVIPFNRILVPLIWLQRRVAGRKDALERGLTVPPRIVNTFLERVLRFENALGRLFGAIPGASLWFAARREA